jgi:hypothetical protein
LKQKYALLVVIVLAITLAGCASQYAPDRVSNPYGFFFGIWHGMIFPLALMAKLLSWIVSLFGISFLDSVTIFGRPNTGFFYYFGFVLGLGALGGGGSQAA